MPAPSSSDITNAIDALLTAPRFPAKTTYFQHLLAKLGEGMNTAWVAWQNGITGGGNAVSGAGLGPWTGTGSGGSLAQGVEFQLTIALTEFAKTGYFLAFEEELADAIKAQFANWVSTFAFGTVNYEGESTATLLAPGTFEATNTAGAIGSLGSGTSPQAVRSTVCSTLNSDHGFFTGEAVCRMADFLDAIDTAIGNLFTTWLAATQFSGETVTGVAAIATGIGSANSNTDGILT